MHRISQVASLILVGQFGGCINDVVVFDPPPELGRQLPQRDEWRVEIDAPLAEDVARISLGGRSTEENFGNRGDIEVRFDGREGRIQVELRRYAFAEDLSGAQPSFDRLWAWAYAGESLRAPTPGMAANDCSVLWHDDCELRVYYDGQNQPGLSGADLRVTLPPSYRGHLAVVTEDNTRESGYPMRGDVHVVDLPGTADIELERGTVEVSLADDVLVAPACGREANDACAAWQEEAIAAPWALACGCSDFGSVSVDGRSANVVVDVPASLWANLRVENAYEDQVGLECAVRLDCEDFDECEVTFTDEDVHGPIRAEANDPGPSALEGAGFLVTLSTDACSSVDFVDAPEDYEEPRSQRRGDLRICSGCLDD